jgi:hypothetical protein
MTEAEAEKWAAAYGEFRPAIEKVPGSEREEPIPEPVTLMPTGGPKAPGFGD